jgi:hypothetical protein
VIWIVMENKPASAVLGVPEAPYLDRLARQCAHAATYFAVSHPSLPNYLALTSGSTQGVTDDAGPASHPVGGPSVFSEAAAARVGWAAYAESMPSACFHGDTPLYAVRHNPATYYTSLASSCAAHDRPLGSPTTGPFVRQLRSGALPGFTFVTPNICDDMHDCGVATGDAWLRAMMNTIVGSRTYAVGRTAVFVTWDEDDGSSSDQVALLAVAPSVRPGTTARGRFGHTALLRTTEAMLGLPVALASSAPDMRRAFHL